MFLAALKACTSLVKHATCERESEQVLQRGKTIHASVLESGCHSDLFIANTLVDFYSKCGDFSQAQAVFESIPRRSTVSWNALMLGHVEKDQGDEALKLFAAMDCEPDMTSLVAALKACSTVAGLDIGKCIHAQVCRLGVERKPVVASALVDLYAKSGSMVLARLVFDTVEARTVTWTALIAGYSRQGDTDLVFELFQGMQEQEVDVDGITLASVMNACSHAGLVDKGKKLFQRMEDRYGVKPGMEHYHCLIDLYGRSGSNGLEDAFRVVESMPLPPNAVTWTTLLAACNKWKNVPLGEVAFQAFLRISHRDVVAYMLMGNIYASRGRWKEQEQVLSQMKQNVVNTP